MRYFDISPPGDGAPPAYWNPLIGVVKGGKKFLGVVTVLDREMYFARGSQDHPDQLTGQLHLNTLMLPRIVLIYAEADGAVALTQPLFPK